MSVILDGLPEVCRKKTKPPDQWFKLSFVIRTGFKPVTRSLEGCCSIQLSYRTNNSGAN